jgi:flagellar basal-body rod protein FlgC
MGMINVLSGINSTASALNAERIRMEVISQNIANVNTLHDADGKPYQRRQVVFETALSSAAAAGEVGASIIKNVKIQKDKRDPLMVPMPDSPDADADGMVAMPNIQIHEEMADYITSSRTYEANLAVVKNARQMAQETLSIVKH